MSTWTETTTANGPVLVTDDAVAAVELPRELSDAVCAYTRANRFVGPVVEMPNGRRLHLVTGLRHAGRAVAALRGWGAVVHTDGAVVALPGMRYVTGTVRWAISPDEARWTPPIVLVSAAVRAARAGEPVPQVALAAR